MADQYIDQLTEETAPATGDLALIEQADLSTENKITLANLWKAINALTAMTDVASGDSIAVYDASGSAAKKATMLEAAAGMGRIVQLPVIEWTTNCSTGDGKFYIVVPSYLNGLDLIGVHAKVITAGTTGTMDIQIRNVTQAADMLTVKITI